MRHVEMTVYAAFTALLLIAAMLLYGCRGKPSGDPSSTDDSSVVIDIPGDTSAPATAVTPEPTAAPTPEPSTLEGRILSGLVYALNGGEMITASYSGEDVDIDLDGHPDSLCVKDIDGGPVFCIGDEPFMDIGSRVYLASLDGSSMVFLSETDGEDGYRVFYPDEEGNLYCRLFAIARSGRAIELEKRGSYEEYIRNGLDIMLHNPRLYSSVEGSMRTVLMDMDGDGSPETIEFDDDELMLNGTLNAQLPTTTMPRFVYDPERDTIVLYGSAGDYAIKLFIKDGVTDYELSYASLL